MSAFEPNRIKRLGIVVELEDGQLITLYTDSPSAEMTIETIREIGHPFEGYGRPVITSSETEIVISAIGSYRMSAQAAEATAKAIDNAKEITQ